MGRPKKRTGPRTVTVGWANLREFCADCLEQRQCPRSLLSEVMECGLVQEQLADDRGRSSLHRHRHLEVDGLVVRQPFSELEPEQVNGQPLPRDPGMPWALAQRMEWIRQQAEGGA